MSIETFISFTLTSSVSICYAILGITITERAGVLNLAVEGVMAISAYAALVGSMQSQFQAVLYPLVLATSIGIIYSIYVVKLARDQVLTGLLVSLLLVMLANFMGTKYVSKSAHKITPDFLMYLLPLVVYAVWFVIHKTTLGLNIRAVSESPEVAHSLGVHVNQVRLLAIICGFGLVGLAGTHLVLALTPVWGYNLVGGRGWIAYALALAINRKPKFAIFASITFSAIFFAQFAIKLNVSTHVISMLPSAAAFLIVVLFPSSEPQALGKAWRKRT